MTDNEKYLKEELERFHEIIVKRVTEELKLKPTSAMIEHLLFAEKKIEEAIVFHTGQYERRIKTLEENELASKIPPFTMNKQNKEEHYKREFHREMTYSVDTWFDHIDICKILAETSKAAD